MSRSTLPRDRDASLLRGAYKGLRLSLAAMAVAVSLGALTAHADEYADVNRLLRAGQFGEALTKADQYLASKPRDPQMRFLKGVVLTEQGKQQDAITVFTKLTEDFPELPEPYNNLAVLHASAGQFDRARAALEMAIRTNPSYSTAHENLGDVYAKLASQAYSRALQLDASNSGVQPKLALIRDIFAPGAKGVKPSAAAPAAAPAAVAAAPTRPAQAAAPAATPAPAPAAAPSTPAPASASSGNAQRDVEAAVKAWADAWAAKDMKSYLAAYGSNFDPPGEMSRKAWEEERRERIVGKSSISVKLSNLSTSVNGDKATVKFRQDYSADTLRVTSRKTLDLVKSGDRWVIVRESTGA